MGEDGMPTPGRVDVAMLVIGSEVFLTFCLSLSLSLLSLFTHLLQHQCTVDTCGLRIRECRCHPYYIANCR